MANGFARPPEMVVSARSEWVFQSTRGSFPGQNYGEKMSDETITIQVGHSPDPDDAFMFHALAND
ncbi:MAG: hypothetical protein Ct9H300mP1_12430 [Planctomycetaceae bacterium]|nr:MAG: hypothetical protein Ct9H300mP1_12430 [Planctomycetaceae bacterium]